jgi:hypothetical protein
MQAERLVQIHAQPHPLRAELLAAAAPEGMTLAEMLGKDAGAALQAWVGDVRVPREHWSRVRPKAGAVVTVRAVAMDGDGNKVLRTVLQIAVLIAASYIPVAGVWGKIAYAGAVIGGTLAVNALVPPQLPRTDRPATGLQALAGTQNQVSPFAPIPRVYGRTRLYPPFAASPYTEVVGNDQYLRLLLCLGYGPLEISDMKIGETPISAEGTLTQGAVLTGTTYENVQFEISSAPTLFSNAVFEEALSVAMNTDGDQQQRVSQIDTQEISLDVAFPIGIISIDDDGDKRTTRVHFKFEYRLAGTANPWLNAKDAPGFQVSGTSNYPSTSGTWFEGRSFDARRASVRWEVAPGQYDVRITRGRSEFLLLTEWKFQVSMFRVKPYLQATWTALRSVGSVSVTPRADMLYLAMRIKATEQLNGLIDTVNCIAQSVLHVWDGASFSQVATSNPAWAYLDAACGIATERALDRNTRFLLSELKSWADDCTAAGREFNCEVASTYGRTTVFELMREIAAVGRASFSMRDGKYTVVRDLAGQATVQVFSPRNSWGFSVERTFQQVPHALRLRFANALAGYTLDERVVYDDGYAADNATRFESLELRGITDPDQAWKEARYHLAVARLRSDIYTLNADIENLVCQRGDLVRVGHDVISVGLAYGRIKAVGGTVLTLDELVTMEALRIYAVRIRKSDGAVVIKTVITEVGQQQTVAMTSAEAGVAAGDLFVFGELDTETIAAKVLKIEPAADLTARLTLVPEAAGVQTADGETAPVHQGPTSGSPLAPETPRAYHAQSDETVLLEATGGGLTSRIVVYYGFQASARPPAATVEAQYRLTGQRPWTSVPIVAAEAGQVSLLPVEDGLDYDYRLRAIAADGTWSGWTTVSAHRVIGKTTPPPDVETFYINGRRLVWTYPSPPKDFSGFLVRYNLGQNTNWDDAIEAHSGTISAPPFDALNIPSGEATIMIKGIDIAGFVSIAPATIIADLPGQATSNVEYLVTDYSLVGFPGTITAGTVSGTDLEADETFDIFWAGSDTATFWEPADADLFWDTTYETLVYEATYTPPFPDPHGTLSLNPMLEGIGAAIDFRTYGQGSFWGAVDAEMFWSDESSIDSAYNGYTLRLTGGAGSIQEQEISGYIGSTKVATVPLNWLATYLELPGVVGSYASTPDSAAVSITGDIDLRAKVAMDDWTPAAIQSLIGKWLESGDQRSFALRVGTDGRPRLIWSTDGTGAATVEMIATAAPSIADGETLWVRATLDVDDGAGNRVAKFYTSTDGAAWTQLGSTVTTAGTASIFDGTAVLHIGGHDATIGVLAGNVYQAEVHNGVDGPLVASFVAAEAHLTDTAVTSIATEEVYTLFGTAVLAPAAGVTTTYEVLDGDGEIVNLGTAQAGGNSSLTLATDSAVFWEEGVGAWRPWPGMLLSLTREQLDYRVTIQGGLTQGIIFDFPLVVTLPAIEETLDDLVIGAAGSRLPIARTYREILNVALTLQDDGGSAASIRLVDKAPTGPLVKAFNNAGTGVTATIDARLRGI